MKVGVRSYYSVGRPPVKFRRIRSSFDSPTVKHIAVPLPVPSSDVSVSETAAGLQLLFSPLGPTPLHSPLAHLPNPPPLRTVRSRSNGSETASNPLTLASLLYIDVSPTNFGLPLPSTLFSAQPNHQRRCSPPFPRPQPTPCRHLTCPPAPARPRPAPGRSGPEVPAPRHLLQGGAPSRASRGPRPPPPRASCQRLLQPPRSKPPPGQHLASFLLLGAKYLKQANTSDVTRFSSRVLANFTSCIRILDGCSGVRAYLPEADLEAVLLGDLLGRLGLLLLGFRHGGERPARR